MKKTLVLFICLFVICILFNGATYYERAGGIYFDATDDKVFFGDANFDWMALGTPFSVGLWIRPENVTTTTHMIGKSGNIHGGGTGWPGWTFGVHSGLGIWFALVKTDPVYSYISDNGGLAAYAAKKGKWTFLSCCYTGGSITAASSFKIYVNGDLLATTFGIAGTVDTITNNNQFYLAMAGDGTPNSCYGGDMDTVMVFNRVVEGNEWKYLMWNPPSRGYSGLYAYWDFNEFSSESAIRDLSGNGNHSITIAGTTVVKGVCDVKH